MYKNNQDPDPLVRGMDPRIRIRIHTKMSWIRNPGLCEWSNLDGDPVGPQTGEGFVHPDAE
jgi:hypothetical protein